MTVATPVTLPATDLAAAALVLSTGWWQRHSTVPAARGTPVGLSAAWTGKRLFAWVTAHVHGMTSLSQTLLGRAGCHPDFAER
jgi:hypothetical protein